MDRETLERHITEQYGAEPEHLWERTPMTAAFRHASNRKWFALVTDVRKDRLALEGDGYVDIVNLKCDPLLVPSLVTRPGFRPAYHMNKRTWVTALLDGTAPDAEILTLLDESYRLTS